MMPSRDLFVSVIMPAYNAERFIADAIESIRQQQYDLLEIVVVDDGSTDRTAAVVGRFGPLVRYVYQPNSGPPAARNRGLEVARGNVLGFLDADDLWTADKLQLQLPRLIAEPSIDVIYGRTQIVLQSEGYGPAGLTPYEEPKTAMTLQASLIRKAVFDKVGKFDTTQRFADDVDWFLRARDLGVRIVGHPEVTWYYRRHDQNITNQVGNHQDYLAMVIKKSLERRRHGRASLLEPPASDPR